MIPRRGFLAGLGALLAAPAIIRTPGLLMPVRPVLDAYPGLDEAFLGQIVDAWVREMREGMTQAVIEMNRERLKQRGILSGSCWTDEDVARMRRVG